MFVINKITLYIFTLISIWVNIILEPLNHMIFHILFLGHWCPNSLETQPFWKIVCISVLVISCPQCNLCERQIFFQHSFHSSLRLNFFFFLSMNCFYYIILLTLHKVNLVWTWQCISQWKLIPVCLKIGEHSRMDAFPV